MNGKSITRESGTGPVSLNLGSPNGTRVVVSNNPVEEVEYRQNPNEVVSGEVSYKGREIILQPGVTRIGRAQDNDVVLSGSLASAHHAHLVMDAHALQIIDLASERGTFVNGERIKRAEVKPQDRVTMGGSAYVVTENQTLVEWEESSGVDLEARGVSVTVGGVTLLHDASFHLPPRSVLAVVGQSGSGKSTMLGALTGFRPATTGQTLIGGRDLYSDYDELRFQVGLVPQQDLVPTQLRVRDALDFSAKLRFPRDTSPQERRERVDQVMSDLGLTARADLRIDRLSGGQRKRVSVALEMLTQPALLFLDEPTSGLDPGLDRQVMILLRELADSGRTVVVVTHSVENLHLADHLMVLAAGGFVAYYGPPHDAPEYFGVEDMSAVFLAMDGIAGDEWDRRWKQHVQGTNTQTDSGASVRLQAGATFHEVDAIHVSRPKGSGSQFLTLIARNLKVIAADRTYAALLLILPLVLALTGFMVGSSAGLGEGGVEALYLNPEARLLLMVLVLGSVFTGAATSIQELVKDRVVYQRERAVGLSRLSYIGAKAVVLGSVAAIQGFVFAILALAGRPGPTDPLLLPGSVEIAVVVSAATVASCMLGLVLSGFLPSRDAALPALVIATMIQVVFSGAIPLRSEWLLDAFGWAMPAYWEFEAMAASVNLSVLTGDKSGIWLHEVQQWRTSFGVLGLMAVGFVILAILVSRRHDPGRR
jgi:ABC-type multidrug transport system ATPase subunit